MPIITVSAVHAWYCMGGSDVISTDMPLWALFLLALNDPWQDFRRLRPIEAGRDGSSRAEKDVPREGSGDAAREREETTLLEPPSPSKSKTLKHRQSYQEQPYPSDLRSRLLWVGTLLVSIRLHHWKVAKPSHDRTQPPPPAFRNRKAFLLHSIQGTLVGFAILDLTSAYTHADPFFTDVDITTTSPLPFHPYTSGFPAHAFRTLILALQLYALIGQMFHLPAASPVLLNAIGLIPDEWSPHTWPLYFGSPRTLLLHGIRGWWGKFWHQTMRWSVSAPGMALADVLGLAARGLARSALVTVVAFGLSGFIHTGLVPPEPLFATMSPGMIRVYMGAFFWLQPVGMIAESLVARAVVRTIDRQKWQSGSGLGVRMLANATWVFFWGCFCAPFLMEAGRQLGWWRVWPLPVSLYRGLKGDGWVT